MSNILIINGHQYYPFSEGKLNATLVDTATTLLQSKGHQTRIVTMEEEIDIEQQLAHHQWADFILFQSPINWMGVTWSFKKYMDEVYTAGMAGALCHGDGRSAQHPTKNYGKGGTLQGKKYMLSVTFNAPKQAFDDKTEFFDGKSVDDLLFPMHMNFKFFNMAALPTFSCFDVMKNADIENDLIRFSAHIDQYF
ncbi:NAD(P)H-dependent oxidoreductase [Pseudoalteromonas luteoviolacea]|uniref:Flavodoxin n=1 Tax=Pseudoalteromonas luteoviolacea S4054 TaxID=1129367 RepID=A0A0F6AI89_9GAMM|nr:NAD(P)H-dependent oxidoreductase [Pseudoalteromonas luteoviolacea]AOT07878.1 flavodoxin [Pseudoalteromonas luteoviolacea]AOT12794.1 flavodoxin [Pseudoalteromonas luteoviolacea]AOT17707.1 flavodoxin [Pseudoalteromonas luteoviolacea]KKE85883.1 flavodoxin [Pseudoalteromonas luteoviolacea S4054]KZN74761.1 flavodoxin [Pseudoalteromonas luteoviolacea S4047-1]